MNFRELWPHIWSDFAAGLTRVLGLDPAAACPTPDVVSIVNAVHRQWRENATAVDCGQRSVPPEVTVHWRSATPEDDAAAEGWWRSHEAILARKLTDLARREGAVNPDAVRVRLVLAPPDFSGADPPLAVTCSWGSGDAPRATGWLVVEEVMPGRDASRECYPGLRCPLLRSSTLVGRGMLADVHLEHPTIAPAQLEIRAGEIGWRAVSRGGGSVQQLERPPLAPFESVMLADGDSLILSGSVRVSVRSCLNVQRLAMVPAWENVGGARRPSRLPSLPVPEWGFASYGSGASDSLYRIEHPAVAAEHFEVWRQSGTDYDRVMVRPLGGNPLYLLPPGAGNDDWRLHDGGWKEVVWNTRICLGLLTLQMVQD